MLMYIAIHSAWTKANDHVLRRHSSRGTPLKKKKKIPHEDCRLDAHLPYLGLQPTGVTPDLRSSSHS